MADEQKAIEDGNRASQLLKDEVFLSAVEDTRKKIFAAWEAATTAEAREKAHSKLSVLSEIVSTLAGKESTGQLTKHRIERSGKTRY